MTCPLREIVRKYWTVYYLQKIFGKNIRGKWSYHRFSWKCRTVYSRLLNKEGSSLYRDGLFCGFLIAPIGAINIRRYTCEDRNAYMCNILCSQKESDSFLKVTFVSIPCFSHENPAKSKSDNTIILYKARIKKFILSCRIP